jgi:hypothetical protein
MRSKTAVLPTWSPITAQTVFVPTATNQRFRCSQAVSWAWLDLNQRPHPQVKIRARNGKLPGTYPGPRRSLDSSRFVRFNQRGGAVVHPASAPVRGLRVVDNDPDI